MEDKLSMFLLKIKKHKAIQMSTHGPAPAAAGAAPPKNQGNREARSAIYATAAVPIFDHVFLLLLRGFRSQIVSMALLGPWRKTLSKTAFENRDFGV